jgi:hypothetical protein
MRGKQLIIQFALALSVVASLTARASVLSEAATALAPGGWVQISTLNSDVIKAQGNFSILEYANKWAWDPIGKRGYYCGAAHHNGFENKCVQYDEATNTWSTLPLPPGYCTIGNCGSDGSNGGIFVHGYDHNAFDTLRRVFYFRNSSRLLKFDVASQIWSQSSEMPSECSNPSSLASLIEYFPNVDRIVMVNHYCQNSVVHYNPTTDTWTSPNTTGVLANGGYHLEGAYSKDGFVYAGCGNSAATSLSRVDITGAWQEMAALPVACLITTANLIGDPASGRILIFPVDSTIRELDPSSNMWLDTGVNGMYSSSSGGNVVAPVPNYGVVLMVRFNNGTQSHEMWIYKHALSPPITIPNAPSMLQVE